MSLKWIKIRTISVTANVILFIDIIYLFFAYYGIINSYFNFLSSPFWIFVGWMYLFLNIVAVNIFEYVRRKNVNKICPLLWGASKSK